MKKRLLGIMLAAMMLVTVFALPVAADDDQELTNATETGNTEVEAQITDTSGEVAYIVTVPKKIDFGKLHAPSTDEQSIIYKDFTVSCVEMNGIDRITVGVMNRDSIAGEANQPFYLTNSTNTACTFKPNYGLGAGNVQIDTSGIMPDEGYTFGVFTSAGTSIPGHAGINQQQLYPYRQNISEIAGVYTGTLVFTTLAEITPAP